MLTREEILNKTIGHVVLTLPSGGQVKVRGLTRNEAIAVQQLEDMREKDNAMIAAGLVEPAMTVDDVAAWAEIPGSAGDTTEVSFQIATMSGFSEGAGKSGVGRARGKSRS